MASNITKTRADVFIPELWSKDVQEAARFDTKLVARCYNPPSETYQFGDTVHVGAASNLEALSKSAGTDFAFSAVTEAKTDVAIDQHKYVAVLLEDIVKVQSNVDLLASYRKSMAYVLERGKETTLTALADALTGNGTIGSAGVPATVADYTSVWQKLQEAGVGASVNVDDDVTLALSPAMLAGAFQLSFFSSRDFNPGADVNGKAMIGKILNMPVIVSNLLESDAAGQHDNFAFHKTAFCVVDQYSPSPESDYLIWKGGTMVVVQSIYGIAELGHAPETPAATDSSVTLVDTRGVLLAGL